MKPKVYIETTIISYLASKPSRDLITAAHQQITHDWWEAPSIISISTSRNSCWMKRARRCRCGSETHGVAGQFPAFGRHVGTLTWPGPWWNAARSTPRGSQRGAYRRATVHHIQFLLTWNCTHLANAEILAQVQAICAKLGYAAPIVCTRSCWEAKMTQWHDRSWKKSDIFVNSRQPSWIMTSRPSSYAPADGTGDRSVIPVVRYAAPSRIVQRDQKPSQCAGNPLLGHGSSLWRRVWWGRFQGHGPNTRQANCAASFMTAVSVELA